MLPFLIIFAVSIAAVIGVQALDVECVKPTVRRKVVTARGAKPVEPMYPNAITGTR